MELIKAMEGRFSTRAYKPDAVPDESLSRILRAAQVAPSWKNRQAWEIIVIGDREIIRALGKALSGNPRGVDYETVPMMLALAMNPERVDVLDGKDYYLVDAGILGEHMVLAAHAEGLGSCWIGWFEEAPIASLLSVPSPYRIVMLTPLGYPAEERKMRPCRDISEFVHYERW